MVEGVRSGGVAKAAFGSRRVPSGVCGEVVEGDLSGELPMRPESPLKTVGEPIGQIKRMRPGALTPGSKKLVGGPSGGCSGAAGGEGTLMWLKLTEAEEAPESITSGADMGAERVLVSRVEELPGGCSGEVGREGSGSIKFGNGVGCCVIETVIGGGNIEAPLSGEEKVLPTETV